MDVTPLTWIVAVSGLMLIALLGSLQFVAVIRPRSEWTVKNVYGGTPEATHPTAYFAFNQGYAWADVFFWVPLQVGGSIGMVLGQRWGFLLALVAAVPYIYSAFTFFIWDRDLGFRQKTLTYWVIVWGIWPAFGVVSGVYCFWRLLGQ